MNTTVQTTGTVVLTSGSTETFLTGNDSLSGTSNLFLNGQPWNLSGGSVSLVFIDPSNNRSSVSATISPDGFTATATWVVPSSPLGPWARCWVITPATGSPQVSRSIRFNVVNPPTQG